MRTWNGEGASPFVGPAASHGGRGVMLRHWLHGVEVMQVENASVSGSSLRHPASRWPVATLVVLAVGVAKFGTAVVGRRWPERARPTATIPL